MQANKTAIVMFMIALIGAIITFGVGAMVLGEFNTTLDTDNCATTVTPAQNVFGNGLTMLTNFSAQLGTIGTIGGILLLVVLVALAGVGMYLYGRGKGMF